jgi:hypothetical protein
MMRTAEELTPSANMPLLADVPPPRGRVVYDTSADRFHLYADRCGSSTTVGDLTRPLDW